MTLFTREMELALKGQLADYIEHADEAVLKAAKRAVENVVGDTKERLRGMVRDAGLGTRLANTVRGDVYPERGLARDPAGWIYVASKSAERIFEAFEEGAELNGPLLIPIPGSPADRKNFGNDPPRDQQSKAEWFEAKGVELQYVPPRGGRPAMLVGVSVRLREDKKGRLKARGAKRTKSGGFGKGAATVPLFWIVDHASIPRRLSWRSEFRRAVQGFMRAFAEEFAAELAKLNARFN